MIKGLASSAPSIPYPLIHKAKFLEIFSLAHCAEGSSTLHEGSPPSG